MDYCVSTYKELTELRNYLDRRESPRIMTDAKCWIERESVTLLGTVTNISCGGLFLRTCISMRSGLSVNLTVKMDNYVIAARGHVAWISADATQNGYSGFGICFDEILRGALDLKSLVSQKSELSL